MSWKAAAAHAFARILRPGPIASGAAAVLSTLLKLSRVRRSVALRNLRIAFPSRSDGELREMLARSYEHLVWTGVEFLALQRDPAQVLDWVEAENEEGLDVDGAILLTGHVGNWELTAAWIAQSGRKLTAIVRESDDEGEKDLIDGMRERCGVACMPKTAPMRRCVSLLRRGELLGILPDQHGGPTGICVPFFGVSTATSTGPAVFAHLTKKPLIPVFTRRISPFRHAIRIGEPIEWTERATREETIYDITKRVNEAVEQMVREAPGQWLAQHRRFREIEESMRWRA